MTIASLLIWDVTSPMRVPRQLYNNQIGIKFKRS